MKTNKYTGVTQTIPTNDCEHTKYGTTQESKVFAQRRSYN